MIRIVSDGTPQGTNVFDSEGKPLKEILSVEILPIAFGHLVQARITFANVELDVVADDGEVGSTEEVTSD